LLVVVDRLSVSDESRGRLAEAVGTAFREGDGDCAVILSEAKDLLLKGQKQIPRSARDDMLAFTERFECPNDGTRAPTPTPQLFSFNSPRANARTATAPSCSRRHSRCASGAAPLPRCASCRSIASCCGSTGSSCRCSSVASPRTSCARRVTGSSSCATWDSTT